MDYIFCMKDKRYLVTGGAGFIGSCFVLQSIGKGIPVLNLDKLTYSGNPGNLKDVAASPLHRFVRGDIGDADLVDSLLDEFKPTAVINFAAESHVDRSILDPSSFVLANVLGLCRLLERTLSWWKGLDGESAQKFRFLHISTDEVYGSLAPEDPAFTELTPYAPNSPYSASKAASDHFVRSFHETYGLPTLITNCSNNYGPRQFPEKLIPLVILRILNKERIPVYGSGANIRDWLHVEDHCAAVSAVLEQGAPGQGYNIGGNSERDNLSVVRSVCAIMDGLVPDESGPYERLVEFVKDRAGHDFRYAINPAKLEAATGWKPAYDFEQGLKETVIWYLENRGWLEEVQSGSYRQWIDLNYEKRA